MGDSELQITFAGRSFLLDAQEGADLVAIQMKEGFYEAPLPMLTMAVMTRTNGLFLDVGANNGLYSVLACMTQSSVRAMAFEPYPPVLNVLRRNLDLNGLRDRVAVHEVALSDEQGRATLYLPDASHGLVETSCSLESTFKTPSGSIEVEKKRIDDIDIAEDVALVKVDIEGHESAFFDGAQSFLSRKRPFVFAEMLPVAAEGFSKIDTILDRLDYYKFRLRPDYAIASSRIEFDPKAWNHAFVPREKIDIFLDCCSCHQITAVQTFQP